ncbi:hypothetical protein Hanom_Chr13g01239981 [Helianthus anomalus]
MMILRRSRTRILWLCFVGLPIFHVKVMFIVPHHHKVQRSERRHGSTHELTINKLCCTRS